MRVENFQLAFFYMQPQEHIIIYSHTDNVSNAIKAKLITEGYHVNLIHSEMELFKEVSKSKSFLLLLELNAPDKDGIAITTEIRKLSINIQPYIILMSNKSDEFIQTTAFNAGIDDFITTSYKIPNLIARINAFKRRYLINYPKQKKIHNSESSLTIDREKYVIYVNTNEISLPRKEFEILDLLYSSKNKIFTRQEIAKSIWNDVTISKSRTIDIHIRNIRKKVGVDYVFTKKNVGYFFK